MPVCELCRRIVVVAILSVAMVVPASPGDEVEQRPKAPAAVPSGPLRIDEMAFEMSASTGGDFYFWAPGEFASSPILAIPLESESIVLVAGRLDAGDAAATVEVPVDASVGRLSLFVGVQGRERLGITTPDGSSVLALDERATVRQTRHMLIVTVPDPRPGVWRVEVEGGGRYMVTARAGRGREPDTPELVELIDFDFVERRGRPGHEGYFPVEAPPAAGASAMCNVTLTGAVGDVAFHFVDGAGKPVERLDLVRGTGEVASDEWLGACEVPPSPYRLAVVGSDAAGRRWQRVDSPLRDPHAVRLSPSELQRLLGETGEDE